MNKTELLVQAHALHPIVTIGNKGLTENVHTEIDRGLNDHELIKIKIHATDRKEKKTMAEEICAKHQAELIQAIGNVISIYRKKEE